VNLFGGLTGGRPLSEVDVRAMIDAHSTRYPDGSELIVHADFSRIERRIIGSYARYCPDPCPSCGVDRWYFGCFCAKPHGGT